MSCVYVCVVVNKVAANSGLSNHCIFFSFPPARQFRSGVTDRVGHGGPRFAASMARRHPVEHPGERRRNTHGRRLRGVLPHALRKYQLRQKLSTQTPTALFQTLNDPAAHRF